MKEKTLKLFQIIIIIISLFAVPFWYCDRYYDKDFSSELVDTKEKYIDNQNVSGFLTYGPYVAYKAGAYKVKFDGVCEGKGHKCDVVFWGTVVYSGDYEPGKWINFNLQEDVSQLEFRVIYAGDGAVGVDRVSVRPIYNLREIFILAMWCVAVAITLWILLSTEKKEWIRDISGFFLCVSVYGTLILIYESIIRAKWSDVVYWVTNSFGCYLSTMFFLTVLTVLLYSICNSMRISQTVISILCLGLVLIGHNYRLLRGEPFELTEFVLFKEAISVMGQYKISLPVGEIVLTVWLLVIVLTLGKEKKVIRRNRVISGVVSCIILVILTCVFVDKTESIGVYAEENATGKCYDEYGYLLGMLSVLRPPIILDTPYSRNEVEKIEVIKNEDEEVVKYPNIIYIQNETLYDMSLVVPVRWNVDPLEKLKVLQAEYTSGSMISPMMGGGRVMLSMRRLQDIHTATQKV